MTCLRLPDLTIPACSPAAGTMKKAAASKIRRRGFIVSGFMKEFCPPGRETERTFG